MTKRLFLLVLIILLIMPLIGCARTRSPGVVLIPRSTPTPTATFLPVDAYPAYPSTGKEAPVVTDSPYSPANPELTSIPFILPTISPTALPTRTLTPTITPTLFALAQPLPAPLYYIGPTEDNKQQVWRLERDGSKLTKITHEEKGVTDLDVANDGRLAYLSNNALIVTDAWGDQRKVLARGEPLPVWDDRWGELPNTTLSITVKGNQRKVWAKDEPLVWNAVLGRHVVDENFIKLTVPIWSPDSSLIAFGMDETWIANPDSGDLIRVTEERTDEKRMYQFTYTPVGWTQHGEKIILHILPPQSGHGGDGPPWGLGFVDPRQDSLPINRGTLGCCQYSLLPKGMLLLGDGYGVSEIDPMTGTRQILLPEQDPQKPPNYPAMGWPKQSPDERIYFFTGYGTEAKQTTVLAYVDGKKRPIQYFKPDDATRVSQVELEWLEEALWSANSEIVVVSGYDHTGNKIVYQMSTLDGSVTRLSTTGYNLVWGK